MNQARPRTTPSLGASFRRHAVGYAVAAVFLAAFQFSMNRVDWLSKAAIDAAFGGHADQAARAALTIAGVAIIAFATRIASRYWFFDVSRTIEYELRGALLEKLHELGAGFYRRFSAGEIMSRATSDLLQVRLLFGFGVLHTVNAIFAFASALQVMLVISWRLTIAAAVVVPLTILTTRSSSNELMRRMRKSQDRLGALTALIQENLVGLRVVRAFGLEERREEGFRASNKEYLDTSISLARLRALIGPVLQVTSVVGTLVFFWYGGLLLLADEAHGGITKGAFFAFSLALARMTRPIVDIGFAYSVLQRGRACFARLDQVFTSKPEVEHVGHAVPSSAAVEVRDLSFSYGDRQVLNGVTLNVPAGNSLAIVGRTGSGKSTLAQLIVRLLPTPRETVFVGGVDVCDVPRDTLRQKLTYAQQDAFLFSTTVSRNIGFALDTPDTPEAATTIRRAADDAAVLQEVLDLPQRLDTIVGERGIQLSGGQRQRVALARALASERPTLVLDDPLSAVDAATEARILEALEQQTHARTIVLITHRVAAASKCDEIVVLDGGRVVARGTHDQLLAAEGLYATLAAEQRAAQDLDAVDPAAG